MPIVKIDGVNCRLHLLKFANFYSFLYVIKKAFNNVVQIEDWDIFFPEIDRSVELNIFIGNRRQIKEWLINEKFFFTKLLTFNFEYFFIEDKNCENIKKLNIYTNVMPNIEEFKKKHILDKLLEEDNFCLCKRENKDDNGQGASIQYKITLNSNNLKAINVIEEDILFNRDFVEPIDGNNEENSLKVYFYGTPQCDILDKVCNPKENPVYKHYGLNIKKCCTEISGDTFLCFMVNTGELQPKHLNLVKKFLKLFKLTDDFIKGNPNKDEIRFEVEELTYDEKERKEKTKKGTVSIKIKDKDKIEANSEIKVDEIVAAFKKSFNINFLSVDDAKEILVSSACHNELDGKYKFGSSEEDLDELFKAESGKEFSEKITYLEKRTKKLKKMISFLKRRWRKQNIN